ncbi:molybdopterin-guanine dinucleotide biosynthesis protein [Beutenbergia cavernae DSM 12333]|uniref:Molybdopterin-guanine dinucleotide biosynthesis protein n=1 Tax=Beutenbergia cavernae (strain ATCC BAA-8 / DSM 12333 / CCUG 43141 / JCM 11478 / NBRC 16432 / NCIMB 13614 / HKI 0122) TaxID=471853 RepID=C5BYF3_BEUC1|nr:NTP transferase domain-containing protein [Beutenbergia cavernae]ACQ81053.1 molybdopterin-guanine dinucleotide biosynthesis protein [Beutenbergia cavernae DSM 12333]
MSAVSAVDAVVLAGGRSARLGVDKAGLQLHGLPLLDHVLAATAGARRTVVVGPPDVARPGLLLAREEPSFGGPVAGIAAGLAAFESADGADGSSPAPLVLVLACDVPRAAEAVAHLLAAAAHLAPENDGMFLESRGRDQWLVGVYRRASLDRALRELGAPGSVHGVSVRALVERLACVRVPDPEHASADVDTWDDLGRAIRHDGRE